MTKLEQAIMFLKQGIAIIPLRHRGKEPESSLMNGSWERYKTALPTEYQVNSWLFSTWQNYGVVAGWKGLAILDFDEFAAYEMWRGWFDLLNKHVEVYPMPYIVKTSRGAHVYLSMPDSGSNEKRRGVDVKFHGYVVGPGSIHPSGTQYCSITDFCLVDVFSLDTILPVDLFPKISPSASCGQIGTFCDQLSPVDGLSSQDDLLAIASGTGGGDLISKVKSAVRIESLFSNIQRTSVDGRWYATLCPFHRDTRPSAWIDARRQLFGCNVCGFKPMDAINLYARMHNISESVAVSQMAREVGVWS